MTFGSRNPRLLIATAAALGVGVVCGARLIASSHARSPSPALPSNGILELHVPHARGSIVLDGDMDDPGWLRETARTNAFLGSDGAPARPYSDGRLVWGDGHLYVALYAADEDIRAKHDGHDAPLWLDDSFHLQFADGIAETSFDVSPTGALTDGRRGAHAAGPFDFAWNSDAHVSHELDGTINDPSDDDEEWVIEMAIPFEALGLKGEVGERIGLSLRRCDTTHAGERLCGSWGEAEPRVLVLD